MRAKIIIITSIALTLLSGACSGPEIDDIFISERMEQEEWFFTAESGEAKTKTAFQADEISIWWSPGDEIAIYYGASEASRFAATSETEVAKAVFSGKMKAFTGEAESGDFNYFWSVYPFTSAVSCDGQSVVATLSQQQVAKAGSFAPNTNISIAKSPGLALSFYNACSWFRFTVTKEGVKRVTFQGNNNEDVAGAFRISMGEDNRPTSPVVIDGKKTITLEFSDHSSFEVGKMYYITLLPQVFQKGFSVTFITDTEIGSRSIDSKATFLRSKYNTGNQFDKAIEYRHFLIYDIFDFDGIGVVGWVSDNESQAMLVSVAETQNQDWTTSNAWCKSYGEGWRMPTIQELTLIHNNFDAINASLSEAGYSQLTTQNKCYWSSTVNPNNADYYYRERLKDGLVLTNCGSDEKATSKANYTRAVKLINW